MKRTLLPILVALSAMVLVGCHSGGAYLPKNANKYDHENTSNVVLLGSRVQRSVTTAGNVIETRLPDGRLQISVNLRNREERRIQVQVNCEFKDAAGQVLDATPFEDLILTELAQQSVTFTSLSNKAQRYTVRVREAH